MTPQQQHHLGHLGQARSSSPARWLSAIFLTCTTSFSCQNPIYPPPPPLIQPHNFFLAYQYISTTEPRKHQLCYRNWKTFIVSITAMFTWGHLGFLSLFILKYIISAIKGKTCFLSWKYKLALNLFFFFFLFSIDFFHSMLRVWVLPASSAAQVDRRMSWLTEAKMTEKKR